MRDHQQDFIDTLQEALEQFDHFEVKMVLVSIENKKSGLEISTCASATRFVSATELYIAARLSLNFSCVESVLLLLKHRFFVQYMKNNLKYGSPCGISAFGGNLP